MPRSHGLAREGIIAGVLGATAVAVWFLVVDTLAGHPLYTPSLLGAVMLHGLGQSISEPAHVDMARVALYTVVHYAAFIISGVLAVALVHGSERHPSVLALLLMLFVAFEVAFTGLTSVLGIGRLGELAWLPVAVGNLVAAATMGFYLWRTHPLLRGHLAHALDGTE